MSVPFVSQPTVPPSWETDSWTLPQWREWATAYGERYADLLAKDDARLGLLPSLTAAVRPTRVKRGRAAALSLISDQEFGRAHRRTMRLQSA